MTSHLLSILPLSLIAIASCRSIDPPTERWYHNAEISEGGIVRMDTTERRVFLVFSGHEFAEGGEHIRQTLKRRAAPGAFFFTGDFYRNASFGRLIRALRDDGHYLGAHSDKHLLYASWEKRDSLLVTRGQFVDDLQSNYFAMSTYGIRPEDAPVFLPPYEWYNKVVAEWASSLGLTLVTFTPGTRANADYTIPSMGARYVSSDEILATVRTLSRAGALGGHILLIHTGTDPERTDKLYLRLDELIGVLTMDGYTFGSFRGQ